jgi:hypothetical protein
MVGRLLVFHALSHAQQEDIPLVEQLPALLFHQV